MGGSRGWEVLEDGKSKSMAQHLVRASCCIGTWQRQSKLARELTFI
jgi:hypothetical protein